MKQTTIEKLRGDLLYLKEEMEKYKQLLLDDESMNKEQEAQIQVFF